MSREKGNLAEAFVEKTLSKQGYKTLHRNFYCSSGEIDIIMKKADVISFIEVRFRKTSTFGDGAESVTASKQKKIISAAKAFIHSHPKVRNFDFRFDVANVSITQDNFILELITDAFTLDDQFSIL